LLVPKPEASAYGSVVFSVYVCFVEQRVAVDDLQCFEMLFVDH
jgi:hypothetical protein